MPTVTRTLHPLPFEHLEPRRFEDLIRQLAYDFRNWRALEALGQAGSDGGFDARGFETLPDFDDESRDVAEDSEDNERVDRIWLIQCKREGAIGPKKLLEHLSAIAASSLEGLYGVIFAASCRFSKATSDAFKQWCRERGVQECYLWGRPEIEDSLFQPKNDHLLFAYFGFSLQMRRRQQASTLKRCIAAKRTLNRVFPRDRLFGKAVILRDPDDDRYPYIEGESFEAAKPLWLPTNVLGVGQLGLAIVLRRYLAYYHYGTETWDFATKINQAIPHDHENPWRDLQISPLDAALDHDLTQDWWSLMDANQHHLLFVGFIPYDEVLAVDDIADDWAKAPTVYVHFKDGKPPFSPRWKLHFHAANSGGPNVPFHNDGHIRVFADRFRDLEWEQNWFQRNGISYATTFTEVLRQG